jgi:hypothetical protein
MITVKELDLNLPIPCVVPCPRKIAFLPVSSRSCCILPEGKLVSTVTCSSRKFMLYDLTPVINHKQTCVNCMFQDESCG